MIRGGGIGTETFESMRSSWKIYSFGDGEGGLAFSDGNGILTLVFGSSEMVLKS